MKFLNVFVISVYFVTPAHSQEPYFVSEPVLLNGYVCHGSVAVIQGVAQNADGYQLEILGEDGSWSEYEGISGDISEGDIHISIENYKLRNSFRIRIANKTSGITSYSSEIFIEAQQPEITVNPESQIRCFGERVYFYTNANPAYTYIWEMSENGQDFRSDFTGTKYQGRNSAGFNINTVNTADHDDWYRCVVKDQDGCVSVSQAANLQINSAGQIQPTLSAKLCEGQAASFSVGSLVGDIENYTWIPKSGTTSLALAILSQNENRITFARLPKDLTAVEYSAEFTKKSMNPDGTTVTSSCTYSRERTGYTVDLMPLAPQAVSDSICGKGDVLLRIEEPFNTTYFWHADTTITHLGTGTEFTAKDLQSSEKYFVRYRESENSCFSDFREVTAKVNPLPVVVMNDISAVCLSEMSFAIPLVSNSHADRFEIVSSSDPLFQFTTIQGEVNDDFLVVNLPEAKSPGVYTFDINFFNDITKCESGIAPVALRIKEETRFSVQPDSQTLCEGETLTLNAEVLPEDNISYQWYRAADLIPGQTFPQLNLNNIAISDAGLYSVSAVSDCGVIHSDTASIELMTKTKVQTHPIDQQVCEGSDAEFTVQAAGTGVLRYEWELNGVSVGNDSERLLLQNISLTSDRAKIRCVITGDCGEAISSEAVLTVMALPEKPIVSNLVYCQNSEAAPLTTEDDHGNILLWFGTDGLVVQTPPVPETNIEGITSYYVSQQDGNGCESDRAELKVTVSSQIDLQLFSSSASVCAYGKLNREVLLIANHLSEAGLYQYQWGKDGVDIPGETNKEFIGNGAGEYFVRVYSEYCETTKTISVYAAGNSLNQSPVVTVNGNSDFLVCRGASADIIAAGDLHEANYHWYATDNTALAQGVGNNFTVSEIISSQTYYVSAIQDFGSLTCESDRTPVTIDLYSDPDISYTVTDERCSSFADGGLNIESEIGALPFEYSLNGGLFQNDPVFYALEYGDYFLTVKDVNGCTATKSVTIGKSELPEITSQPADQTNCKGNVVTFRVTTTSTTSFQWQKKLPDSHWENISNENSASLRVASVGNALNPNGTQYRVIVGTDPCVTISDPAVLYVNEFLDKLEDQTLCEGETATYFSPAMNGSALSYEWQKRVGATGAFLPVSDESVAGLHINSIASAEDQTYYRVKITFDRGNGTTCVETSNAGKLAVIAIDETILTGTAEICSGESTTLIANGCNGLVEWSDGQTGASIIVSPEETTIYTAVCKIDQCAKNAANEVTITVKSGVFAPEISASQTEVCFGETTTLTAENCNGDLQWRDGQTQLAIIISPVGEVQYSAICSINGCISPVSNELVIVGFPELTGGSILEIAAENCSGYNPPNLTSTEDPSGGRGTLTYVWEQTENCDAVNPIWTEVIDASGKAYNPPVLQNTTCYRRKVTDKCGAIAYSNTSKVTIHPDPEISVLASSTTICSGESFDLVATIVGGAGNCNIVWQRNLRSSAPGSGFWEDLSFTSSEITISETENRTPNTQTVYYRAIYNCELNSCKRAISVAIEVQIVPKLSVEIIADRAEICSGESITLSANGCNGNLLWSDGQTASMIEINPITSNWWYVSCSAPGCDQVAKDSVEITVKSGVLAPEISVSQTEVCYGEAATLTAANCNGDLLWSDGQAEFEITISPVDEVRYTAICSTNGCISPVSNELVIVGFPELTGGSILEITAENCSGYNPPNLTSTEDPSGGRGRLTYVWEQTGNCDATNIIWTEIISVTGKTYNPSVLQTTTCYRRRVTDECGAVVYSNTSKVTVHPDPEISVTASSATICSGESFDLTATIVGGAGSCTISWQQNLRSSAPGSAFWEDLLFAGNEITIIETENRTPNPQTVYHRAIYNCELNSCNRAVSTAVEVQIAQKLSVEIIADRTEICSGESTSLTATGCNGLVEWSDGQTGISITVSPQETTTYTVVCKIDQCSKNATDEIIIKVKPGVSAPEISASQTEICFGGEATLIAENCSGDLLWSNGETQSTIIISPVDEVRYTAICSANGCVSPVSNELIILGYPELRGGSILEITAENCSGYNPPNLTSIEDASGGKGMLKYVWEQTENCDATNIIWTEIISAADKAYNPPVLQTTTCYRRRVTDECGAIAYSNTSKVTVQPDPEISVTASLTTICSDESVQLSAVITGGAGNCNIVWQRNLRSSAPGSTFWEDLLFTGNEITITETENQTSGIQSVYYRAIYNCELNSCNRATSSVVGIQIKPSNEVKLNFTDTTVCENLKVNLVASSCGDMLFWENGSQEISRSILVNQNAIYTATCSGECGIFSVSTNINVIPGVNPPENTTPVSVILPQALFFTAEGTDLRWYTSEKSESVLAKAPEETQEGKYEYWVSQSNGECESPRLKIQSVIYPALTIEQQPLDQYNCKGNSVSFQVKTVGAGRLYYQWQRKKPDEHEFSDISDEDSGVRAANDPVLRISAIGNADNPNRSQYRCIVGDSLGVFVSDHVTLFTNVINGTIPNINLCRGQEFVLKLSDYVALDGDVKAYQWQIRDDVEGKWLDFTDDYHVRGTETSALHFFDARPEHARRYRCRIFFNTGGYECIQNTDQTSIKVGEYPPRPPDMSVDYCIGQSTRVLSYNANPYNTIWYSSDLEDAVGATRSPRPSSESAGVFTWWFSAVSNEKCASPKARYTVTIHNLPEAPESTTPAFVVEPDTLIFNAFGSYLKWYTTRAGRTFDVNPPKYAAIGQYTHYVSQSNIIGCESERTLIASRIIGTLGFTKELENLADCDGNSVRFFANAKGLDTLRYIWQKKRPDDDEFVTIPDETAASLLVSNAGSGENPHLTIYRVIVSDSTKKSVTSNEAYLFVNKINQTPARQVYCESSGIRMVLNENTLQGEVNTYQFQGRTGNSWTLLSESALPGFDTLADGWENYSAYRLRVGFSAENNSTCFRNSNVFQVGKAKTPDAPGNRSLPVALFNTLEKLELDKEESLVYRFYQNDSTAIDQTDQYIFDTSGVHLVFYSKINSEGCESRLDTLFIHVMDSSLLRSEDFEIFTRDRFKGKKPPEKTERCYVYPNPLNESGAFSLFTNGMKAENIQLSDVLGNKLRITISDENAGYLGIRLNDALKEGVYLLNVFDRTGKSCVIRLVKNL
jgi:hypothetical protein